MAEAPDSDDSVEFWLNEISQYDKDFKKWQARSDKILKRYRDDGRSDIGSTNSARFNILWSNVNTLIPACYNKVPQPDVSRRFRDNDPVGRVASLILERALEFELHHYSDYKSGLRNAVQDRFLPGRGICWVRYEPKFETQEVQVTEDLEVGEDAETQEVLETECSPVDYVHWRDFGHSKARTWEEVRAVWRIVYMSEDAVSERFGAEIAKKVPYNASPDEKGRSSSQSNEEMPKQARIYEIWDKTEKKAYWLSKSMPDFLDTKDDPLNLETFFPCPKPLYATLTTDSLVPVPDFVLYQDQAKELDILCDRIDGLIKALQVKGVYNSAIPELARLFTEGENTSMIPVKDWTAFSEKNGLRGAIDLVELQPIFQALLAAYQAQENVKGQIYEITGMSDIIRGESVASETATAQNIKSQFASLRMRNNQQDVAQFATDLMQIKAQIICNLYDPQTLIQISGVGQLLPEDQAMVPQAIQLLKQNTLRDFRIEIAADSLVQLDESQEKQDRMEFLGAIGNFMEKVIPAAQQTPALAPLMAELLKYGVTAYRVGRSIEGKFDSAIDALIKAPPQNKPDPEMMKLQASQQQAQAAAQASQQKVQMDAQLEQAKLQFAQQKQQFDQQMQQAKEAQDAQQKQAEIELEHWRAMLEADTKVVVAQIAAKTQLQTQANQIANDQQKQLTLGLDEAEPTEEPTEGISELIGVVNANMEQLISGQQAAHQAIVQHLAKPRQVIRDANGRMIGVQ